MRADEHTNRIFRNSDYKQIKETMRLDLNMPTIFVQTQPDVIRLVHYEVARNLDDRTRPNVNAVIFATDLSLYQDLNLQGICHTLAREVNNFGTYKILDAGAIFDPDHAFLLPTSLSVIDNGQRYNENTATYEPVYVINNENPLDFHNFVMSNYDDIQNTVQRLVEAYALTVEFIPKDEAIERWQHHNNLQQPELEEQEIYGSDTMLSRVASAFRRVIFWSRRKNQKMRS